MTNVKKDKRQIMVKEIALEVTTLIKPFFDSINHRLDGHDRYFVGIGHQFGKIEKRFDGIDGKFKLIDERFDGVDKRLDGIDQRFDKVEQTLDNHSRYFVGIAEQFNMVDHRFTKMSTHFDKRFDALEIEVRSTGISYDVRINRLEKEMGMVRTVLMVGNPKKD